MKNFLTKLGIGIGDRGFFDPWRFYCNQKLDNRLEYEKECIEQLNKVFHKRLAGFIWSFLDELDLKGKHPDETKTMVVFAICIKDGIMYYQCEHCWSKRKKDGTPTKRSSRVIHTHGSPSTDNRVEFRASHCDQAEVPPRPSNVVIIIDNATHRL